MATFTKINSFVEAVCEKKHDLGSDTLTVALTSVAPVATNDVLADLTEIAYTNLSTREITTTSSAETTGTYKLVLTDLVLTATGAVGPFRYIAIYNDTATNKELIGFYDYESEITMANGESFKIDFSEANGVLQLA
jgi:hypothetical protein